MWLRASVGDLAVLGQILQRDAHAVELGRLEVMAQLVSGGEPALVVGFGHRCVEPAGQLARVLVKAVGIGHVLVGYAQHVHPARLQGGVCPFGVNDSVEVYLDESLRRFETVFPAAGSSNSAIELTLEELERASQALGWVDVCKAWRDEV